MPGLAVVFLCVFVIYIIAGGNIMIILAAAPHELGTILGAGIGAMMIGNTKKVLGALAGGFKKVLAGPSYKKEDYLDLLSLLYMLFKLARSKGMLALESHVEAPKESEIFKNFPKILADHHIIDFICDYFRMMTMGSDDPNQMEDLINEELDVHHKEDHQIAGAFAALGDGLPALGIVAAVLGIIKTMASIDKPPEILGRMIGSALVGTFLGVFLAYGIVGPIAQNLNAVYEEDAKMLSCIKVGLLAYMNGFAPAVALEFARKSLMSHQRPSFYDVESHVENLPKV
ncbi:MAG: flagellar motor stator protein MotA [Alphaproteobacteria bacterium]|nr:flagellar motor stator protein MotA [Alphaproteobacteria bacterium]NCQ66160.1 flagellar motor stator protein MotA [Alphaproteobacteria bacterium]NCT06508.1 flagellar motor stator protein MotA [Alphaproteobacteria bacterium]